MKTPILSFSGYSNSGKTTTLVKVLEVLAGKNYKIAVLKHHGHNENNTPINSDHLKDTDKIKLAGASFVKLIIGNEDIEKDLEEINNKGYDLIILEGFKRLSYPKLFFLREKDKVEDLAFTNIIGIISSIKVNEIEGYLNFDNYDVTGIVKIIEKTFLKGE